MTHEDMTNEDFYAAGHLTRALDPATQPPAIRAYLKAEVDLLEEQVAEGARVVDFGCGTGRHLLLLADRLRLGVGVDYERAYLVEALRRAREPYAAGEPTNARRDTLHFVLADAAAAPLRAAFDLATCLTNTWGTMRDKAGVLAEMRRTSRTPGSRLLSVYSEASVPARREWYRRLGHDVVDETSEYLATDGGFRSEHFSETRLRDLVGECTVRPLTDIAFVARF